MRIISVFGILFSLMACQPAAEPGEYTLLYGGTLLDLSQEGKATADIKNAFVLLKADKIERVGMFSKEMAWPEGTRCIDVGGLFILPGLTDGFAAINDQNYCDAYLAMGVTSVVAVDGGRRGGLFGDGNPSPNIYRLEGVGDKKISDEEMFSEIDRLHDAGYKVLLLMYGLTAEQLKKAKARADEYDMATIGELGNATYVEGMDVGLDAFVHTTRYSLDIAPREMAAAVAAEPFSNKLNSPKWQYYRFLSRTKSDFPPLQQHAQNLAQSGSFIIPTSSLSYLDLPQHKNLWDETVAVWLNPDSINRPADPHTGNHNEDSSVLNPYTRLITSELEVLEVAYHEAGAHYLTGSGTDVWGTMPGISLHTELDMLHRIGLSQREVLAAATDNFHQAYGWKIGRITAGFDANILVLKKNPLEDLAHLKEIEMLFLGGEEIELRK